MNLIKIISISCLISGFLFANANDGAIKNNKELEILTSYLPKQLDIEEIENIVKDIIKESGATSMKDMGIVIKTAKEKIGASADGKTISDVVKKLLS